MKSLCQFAHRTSGAALSLAVGLTGFSPLQALANPAVVQTGPGAASPASTVLPREKVAFLQDDQYILGPGDGLSLRFLSSVSGVGDPLSGPVEILPDGTASLPLLGSVRLTDLTLSQATLWLQQLYKRQLLRPELQLTLIRTRPLRISVLGEVERPGLYTMTTQEASATEAKVSISGLPTLVDAIQKAGGVTNLADLSQVTLRRRMPGEQMQFRRTKLDLLALIREGDMVQNPILFDGDTIRVTRAPEAVPEAVELSSTTVSPPEITVNVVGEVVRPGPVQLPANTPLVQAVLAAGGPDPWRAKISRIQLIRINRNGSLTRQAFYYDLGSEASNQSNPPLRDRDTVLVTRSNYAKLADALDAFGKPLTSLASVLSLMQILRNTSN